MLQFKETLLKALYSILIISAPIAVIITISGYSLLDIAFRITDKISSGDIAIMSGILAFFAIALIFQSLVTVMNRAFYAVNNTKTPLLTGFISIIFNVALGFYLKGVLGIGGIALAYSIASFINAGLLFYFLNRNVIKFDLKKSAVFTLKIIIASFICSIILYYINRFFVIENLSKLSKIIYVLIEMGLAILAYIVVMYILKVDIVSNIIRKYYTKIFCRKI